MDYNALKDKLIHLIANYKSGFFNLTAAEIADKIIEIVKDEAMEHDEEYWTRRKL